MIYTFTLNPALDKQLSVPEISFNDVLIAENIQLDFGGKGFNVSRMLAELDETSIALGFLGGATGSTLQEGLSKQGIKLLALPIAGETRTNITIVSTTGKKHIKVNEKGPTVSENELQLVFDFIAKTAQVGTLWVLAGSLPPGLDFTVYQKMSEQIKTLGGTVVLDTSGKALKAALQAKPKLVKPNLFELSQLTGREIRTLAEIQQNPRILDVVGAEFVAISAGEQGALLSNGERIVTCQAPKIEEANPVGAGDAMVAGLTYALYHELEIEDALKLGVACGTAAAMQSGTKMPKRELVEELRQQVQCF